ncbi:M20 family metallopeptidase [Salipiger sp.]|uniref:M20 family metallopeptidase n=1 Tax=Salipiger sp. TaxID=2078585 RepID=UPI003A97F257
MNIYHGIDRPAAIALLSRFIEVPSINPSFRTEADDPAHFGEAALAHELGAWLEDAGIAPEIDEVAPGRPNLIGRVAGRDGRRRMIWEGHLDTVQTTGMAAPFTPRLEGDLLFGRGAVDDGASVVAFMLALRALKHRPPAADVDFVAAMDEEFSFLGVLHHIGRGERYDLGIAGEPTSLRVVRACKGTVRWWVDVTGVNAHTARPEEGLNGITVARHILDAYEQEMARRAAEHTLLGRATLTCTAFEAGIGPNTVPADCRMRFDYRFLPSEAGAEVHERFRAVALEAARAFPGAKVEVPPPFVDSSAMDVPEGSPVVEALCRVCGAHGVDPAPIGVAYGSDATKLVNNAGIPTVIFGPGSIDVAHALDEHVEIEQILRAARMLVDLAHAL